MSAEMSKEAKEAVASLKKAEESLYETVGEGNLEEAVQAVLEAEAELEELEEDASCEDVAEATKKCEEAAAELATKIANARVDCHNIPVDLDTIEEEVLSDYTITDAKE